MDFIDEIKALAVRIPDLLEHIQTEEATKTALIMPFVRALGYDTEDPREIVPEFTADFGPKKSDKVDYAILKDGEPIMLIECKAAKVNLDQEHAAQLFMYFAATQARFGLLTNGVVYRFHSDLDDRHKMDHRPFLEINMLDINDAALEELRRFTKTSFDLESTIQAATELKYTREIKRILAQHLREPTDQFIRMFASQIYSGTLTKSVRDRFAQYTRAAFNEFVNDRVNDRLKSAMISNDESAGILSPIPSPADEEIQEPDTSDLEEIVTTEDELQGFYIIKSLLHGTVDLKRVVMRDMKSYCGVLLDDNNRKPICRLWFNRSQKYLGLFDQEKHEERIPIETLDDIYQYADRLKITASSFDQGDVPATSE